MSRLEASCFTALCHRFAFPSHPPFPSLRNANSTLSLPSEFVAHAGVASDATAIAKKRKTVEQASKAHICELINAKRDQTSKGVKVYVPRIIYYQTKFLIERERGKKFIGILFDEK